MRNGPASHHYSRRNAGSAHRFPSFEPVCGISVIPKATDPPEFPQIAQYYRAIEASGPHHRGNIHQARQALRLMSHAAVISAAVNYTYHRKVPAAITASRFCGNVGNSAGGTRGSRIRTMAVWVLGAETGRDLPQISPYLARVVRSGWDGPGLPYEGRPDLEWRYPTSSDIKRL